MAGKELQVKTVDIDMIKDYIFCPELYRLSHIVNLTPSKSSSIWKLYQYSIREAGLHLFRQNFVNSRVDIKRLRLVFGRHFIQERTKKATLLMDTTSANAAIAYEQYGVKALDKYWRDIAGDVGTVILIDTPYELPLGDIIITGMIPVIREYKGTIEMFDIRDDSVLPERRLDRITLRNDISLIAANMAFKQIFGKEIPYTKVYMMGSGYTHIFSRKLEDMERLYSIVHSVSEAIDKEIYYPAYNFNCMNCAYRDTCMID